MNELIEIIKHIKEILPSLEKTLHEEYDNLLHVNSSMKTFTLIMKHKIFLFKKLRAMQKDRLLIEKNHNIFAPYLNNKSLNNHWCNIVSRCLLLQELNRKNKNILNKKFYINQNFLELVEVHSKNLTYDINGKLKY